MCDTCTWPVQVNFCYYQENARVRGQIPIRLCPVPQYWPSDKPPTYAIPHQNQSMYVTGYIVIQCLPQQWFVQSFRFHLNKFVSGYQVAPTQGTTSDGQCDLLIEPNLATGVISWRMNRELSKSFGRVTRTGYSNNFITSIIIIWSCLLLAQLLGIRPYLNTIVFGQ